MSYTDALEYKSDLIAKRLSAIRAHRKALSGPVSGDAFHHTAEHTLRLLEWSESFVDIVIASDVFYVAPHIEDIVIQASQQLFRDAPDTELRPEHVPGEVGIVFLSDPLGGVLVDEVTVEEYAHDVVTRGWIWKRVYGGESVPVADHGVRTVPAPGIVLMSLNDTERWNGLPLHTVIWPYGERVQGWKSTTTHKGSSVAGAVFRCQAMSLFLFLQQRVLVTRRDYVKSRSASKRIQRSGVPNVVHVVELRHQEVETVTAETEHGTPRNWNHRWLVRGHWRRQWYPSKEHHETIWVNPYVKGPDDKPFKASKETVYAVAR